jgi:hypothetical protein
MTRVGSDRQLMMDSIGRSIADLRPPEYRGVYGVKPAGFE